jgi:hypothetical protein
LVTQAQVPPVKEREDDHTLPDEGQTYMCHVVAAPMAPDVVVEAQEEDEDDDDLGVEGKELTPKHNWQVVPDHPLADKHITVMRDEDLNLTLLVRAMHSYAKGWAGEYSMHLRRPGEEWEVSEHEWYKSVDEAVAGTIQWAESLPAMKDVRQGKGGWLAPGG